MSDQVTAPVTSLRRAGSIGDADGPLGWLRDEIDRLFEDLSLPRPARGIFAFPGLGRSVGPSMEMIERNGGYVLSLDVPGIDPKDVDIELADGILKVSGERRAASETKDADYLIDERSYGSFCRQASLPGDVDPESLSAHLQDGVLKVEMKRSKHAVGRSRKIRVN